MSFIESTTQTKTLTLYDSVDLMHRKDNDVSIIGFWMKHVAIIVQQITRVGEFDGGKVSEGGVGVLEEGDLVGVDLVAGLHALGLLAPDDVLHRVVQSLGEG